MFKPCHSLKPDQKLSPTIKTKQIRYSLEMIPVLLLSYFLPFQTSHFWRYSTTRSLFFGFYFPVIMPLTFVRLPPTVVYIHMRNSLKRWAAANAANMFVSGSREQLGFAGARLCQLSAPEPPQPPPPSLPAAAPLSAAHRPGRRPADVTLLSTTSSSSRRAPVLSAEQRGVRPIGAGQTGARRQGQRTRGERPDLFESHCLVKDHHRGPSLGADAAFMCSSDGHGV